MKIVRSSDRAIEFDATRPTVTGRADIARLITYSIPAAGKASIVTFGEGSRTHWHEHAAGQILVVLSGSGEVAIEGEAPVAIDEGDIVIADPGEVHWHGASKGDPLTHFAISRGETVWHKAVEGD